MPDARCQFSIASIEHLTSDIRKMFDRLFGNQRAKDILRRMLAHRRVPGALLFIGEDGVGKKLFAIELAKALNCRAPKGTEACDHCVACARIARFPSDGPNSADSPKQIIWSEHRDVGMVRAAGRFIVVPQIREIEQETNYRPYEGAARVFLIEGADRLNEAASNALLKTLEEAPSTSHLILLTSHPANLLPTIRSRCQIVRFAPLTAAEVETYLVKNGKRSGEEARLAAHLSRGRIGHALEINVDTYLAHRDAMFGVLEALTGNVDRARFLRIAEDLSDAKRKEEYEPRLDILEALIHDLWLLSLSTKDAKIINEDARTRLVHMSAAVASRRAASWLTRIEELRRQLAVNINRRVATDALFLAMAEERQS